MSVTIQYRGDSAANWTSANPVLYQREIGVETDTHKAKIGDGATAWASLPYWTLGALAVTSVFGREGAIAPEDGDYTAAMVGALALAGGNMLGWLGPREVALEQSGGSVAINAESGNSFVLELTSSGWTIDAPTNPSPGQKINIVVVQDTSGSRTVAWAEEWNFGPGSAPTLTTTPGAVDILVFTYVTYLSAWCYVGLAPGFSPPPQSIAWVDGVSNSPGTAEVTLRLPGDLAVGNAVIIGVCASGSGNVVPTGFTAATNGATTPSAITPLLTGTGGAYGAGSQLFAMYVAGGDLDIEGGGTATLTFTATGTATYASAAALGAWSGAVLPPGAYAGSALSASPTDTYDAPTVDTVANGSWSVELSMLPDNAHLTTTVPETLTGRTLTTNQVVIADSGAPVGAAGTEIGGEDWTANANVIWAVFTCALNPA